MSPVDDRAGEEYWSALWLDAPLPRPIDPSDRRVRNHLRRRFDRFFREWLAVAAGERAVLLEVGCARSPWLGYFARELGFEVCGLDYSAIGCAQARAMLERDGVVGEVVERDLFDPPAGWLRRFDRVVSFGVVEHFDDTVATLTALGRFLRPGGRIYTLVPNFSGVLGALQRRFDRRFYDMHVILDEPALRAAHQAAGFRILHSSYFLSSNFGVLNQSTIPAGSPGSFARSLVRGAGMAVSAGSWSLERAFAVDLPAIRTFSPYVHCVAEQPVLAAS